MGTYLWLSFRIGGTSECGIEVVRWSPNVQRDGYIAYRDMGGLWETSPSVGGRIRGSNRGVKTSRTSELSLEMPGHVEGSVSKMKGV